jgi:hypothetical protein
MREVSRNCLAGCREAGAAGKVLGQKFDSERLSSFRFLAQTINIFPDLSYVVARVAYLVFNYKGTGVVTVYLFETDFAFFFKFPPII